MNITRASYLRAQLLYMTALLTWPADWQQWCGGG
jgi:hypothetical protein